MTKEEIRAERRNAREKFAICLSSAKKAPDKGLKEAFRESARKWCCAFSYWSRLLDDALDELKNK